MTKITIKRRGEDVSVFHLVVHSMLFSVLGLLLILVLINSTHQIFVRDVGQASSLLFVYIVAAYFFRNSYYLVLAYKEYVQDVVDVFLKECGGGSYDFQAVEETVGDELNSCVVDLHDISLDIALRWAKDFITKKDGNRICIVHRGEVEEPR